MLWQLHWQDPRDLSRTQFVAQSDDISDRQSAELAHERFRVIVEERRTECPAGWGPLICTEDSPMFVHSATRG